MPILEPFRALHSTEPLLFIPGEESAPSLNAALLTEYPEPGLFFYRQQFEGTVRDGIMGLLNRREVAIYPHEQTEPARVEACRAELLRAGANISSLFLWCSEGTFLPPGGMPWLDRTDQFGCRHRIWCVVHPEHIAALQNTLRGKALFLADGHHRFAAGWQLATIQIRTPALRTLAAHRLVLDPRDLQVPPAQPVHDIHAFWEATPPGKVRFGMIGPDGLMKGAELPAAPGERNVSILHREILRNARVEPIRGIACVLEAVQSKRAHMAFLLEPLSVSDIEQDAARGILLPPKSTDFFPKLAGGLVIHRHQNETFMPPVMNRPGVRQPSS